MADDILLSIGVEIAEMTKGFNEAKSRVQEFASSFGALGEVLAGALSIAGIERFVSSMEEMGVQAERLSAQIGLPVEEISRMEIVSRTLGGSSDSLARLIERLEFSMMRAAAGGKMQEDAFNRLGVAYRNAHGQMLPVDQVLAQIADRFRTAPDGPAKTAIAIELMSRAGAEAIPYLNQGSQGLKQLGDEADKTGAVMDKNFVDASVRASRATGTLWDSLKGLGMTLFTEIAPHLTETANNMSATVEKLNQMEKSTSLLSRALKFLHEDLIVYIEKAAAAAAGTTVFQVGINMLADAMSKLHGDFGPVIKDMQQWIDLDAKLTGKPLPSKVIPPPRDLSAESEARKIAEDNFAREKELLDGMVKTYQITEDQKTAYLKVAINDRYAAEVAAGVKAAVAEAERQKEIVKINAEAAAKITEEWKKVADQFASDFSTALNEVISGQKSFTAAMGAMFGRMIEQMIADLVKLIAEYAILNAVAGTALAPTLKAPTLGGLAATAFPALGGLLGGAGQTAQTTAVTANTGALTALTAAITGHAAVTATDTAATTAQTVATAGQTVATGAQVAATSVHTAVVAPNTVATVANTFATELNTIKGFFPGFESGAWDVGKVHGFPSFQAGVPNVPRTMLAVLHSGEMVVPTNQAEQIRERGFGGANLTFQISAMDAQSFGSFLRGGGGNQIANYVARALQQNPSLRPMYTS